MTKPIGKAILTESGMKAYQDAAFKGKIVTPRYFKFSEEDIDLDNAFKLMDINGWIKQDINAYIPIDISAVEYLCQVEPDKAIKYCKICGIYLDDGTLIALAKPPYPFPPSIAQRFKVQVKYGNLQNLTNFSYLPHDELEQDLARLDTQAAIGEQLLKNNASISELQQKLDRLVHNITERDRILNDMYFNTKSMDVAFQKYNEAGELETVTMPNVAKMKADFESWKNEKYIIGDGGHGTRAINVASYFTNGSGATYLHFKLPYNLKIDNKMYHLHIRGYAYGESKAVDATIVGYCYKNGNKLCYLNATGSHQPTSYVGSNNDIYARMYFPNKYYLTVTIDTIKVGNGTLLKSGDIEIIDSRNSTI
jgi:hypothetical protein